MINDLIKLANSLDAKGLKAEADYLDSLIRKAAGVNTPSLEEVLQKAEEYGFKPKGNVADLTDSSFQSLVELYSGTSKFEDILSAAENENMASDDLTAPTNGASPAKSASRYVIIKESFKAAKESFFYIKNAPRSLKKYFSLAISALMAAGYIVWPIDLISDLLTGIGWVDDIIAFAYILRFVASKIDSSGWTAATGSDKPDLIEQDKEEEIEAF